MIGETGALYLNTKKPRRFVFSRTKKGLPKSCHTVYRIGKPWKPKVPCMDEMAKLDHEHN